MCIIISPFIYLFYLTLSSMWLFPDGNIHSKINIVQWCIFLYTKCNALLKQNKTPLRVWKEKPSIKYPLFSVVSKHLDGKKATPLRLLELEALWVQRTSFSKSQPVSENILSYLSNVKHEEFLPPNQHFKGIRQHQDPVSCVCAHMRARVIQIRFLKWNLLSNSLSKGTSNKCEDFKRIPGSKGKENEQSLH